MAHSWQEERDSDIDSDPRERPAEIKRKQEGCRRMKETIPPPDEPNRGYGDRDYVFNVSHDV